MSKELELMRDFISKTYSEKMMWTKDSKEKMKLMEKRNALETSDYILYAELLKVKRILDKGIEEIEKELQGKGEER